MKRLMSLAALGVVLACGTAAAQQVNVKIGVLTNMSEPLCGCDRHRIRDCCQDGGNGFHERSSECES